jgi:hypothetical protein
VLRRGFIAHILRALASFADAPHHSASMRSSRPREPVTVDSPSSSPEGAPGCSHVWSDAAPGIAEPVQTGVLSIPLAPLCPPRTHDRCRRRSTGRAPTARASHRSEPLRSSRRRRHTSALWAKCRSDALKGIATVMAKTTFALPKDDERANKKNHGKRRQREEHCIHNKAWPVQSKGIRGQIICCRRHGTLRCRIVPMAQCSGRGVG